MEKRIRTLGFGIVLALLLGGTLYFLVRRNSFLERRRNAFAAHANAYPGVISSGGGKEDKTEPEKTLAAPGLRTSGPRTGGLESAEEGHVGIELELVHGETGEPLQGATLTIWNEETQHLFAEALQTRSSVRLNLTNGALAAWKSGFVPVCTALDALQDSDSVRLRLFPAGSVVLHLEGLEKLDGKGLHFVLVPPSSNASEGPGAWRRWSHSWGSSGIEPPDVLGRPVQTLAESRTLRQMLRRVAAKGPELPQQHSQLNPIDMNGKSSRSLINWVREPDSEGRAVWPCVPPADGYRIGVLEGSAASDLVGGGLIAFDPPFEVQHVSYAVDGTMQVNQVQGNLSGPFGVLANQTADVQAKVLDSVSLLTGKLIPITGSFGSQRAEVRLIDARRYLNPIRGGEWHERITLGHARADAEGRFSFSNVPMGFDKIIRASWKDDDGGVHFAVDPFSIPSPGALDLGDIPEERGHTLTIRTVLHGDAIQFAVPFKIQVIATPMDKRSPKNVVATIEGTVGDVLHLYGLPNGTASISFSYDEESALEAGARLSRRPSEFPIRMDADVETSLDVDVTESEAGPILMSLPIPPVGLEHSNAYGLLWEKSTEKVRDLSLWEVDGRLLDYPGQSFLGHQFHLFASLKDKATSRMLDWVLDGDLTLEELQMDPIPLSWVKGVRVEGIAKPNTNWLIPTLIDPSPGMNGMIFGNTVSADETGRFTLVGLPPKREFEIQGQTFRTGASGTSISLNVSDFP